MEDKNIKQQVEDRLIDLESKRKVQDVGRVAMSKKEMAAYRIISMNNIDEINQDSIIAYNLVKKESVWEAIDIEQQKLQGATAGATFIKVKIRESLPAKPQNDPAKRKSYVHFLNVLQKDLLPLNTVKEVEDQVNKYINADIVQTIVNLIDPMYDSYSDELKEKTRLQWQVKNGIRWASESYFNRKVMEELFSKTFVNLLTKNSDAGHVAWQMANIFEPSAGNEQEYRDRMKKVAENHLKKRQEEWDEIEKLDTKQFYAFVSTRYKVESLKRFSNPQDIFVNEAYWRKNYERWLMDAKKKFEEATNSSLEIPLEYQKRDNDWSWSVKEEKDGEVKERGRQVNKKVPLEYIKRTNGYKTPEPTPQNIVDLYGFNAYNFGKYVPDNERAEHARHFIGALTDLGEILNIDIAQVHRLVGFGFGVGLKGYGGHLATYFPQTKDVNLVRGKGDGSVAHEWGHFFDNMLSDFSERKALPSYATSGSAKDPELNRLFQELISIFKDGVKGAVQYKTRTLEAIVIDEKTYYPEIDIKGSIEESLTYFFEKNPRLKPLRLSDKFWVTYRQKYLGYIIAKHDLPSYDIQFTVKSLFYDDSYFVGNPKYWVSNVEMFARAFETYIFKKLAKVGMANNYLAHDMYLEESMPYPRGVEYDAIEKTMDVIILRFKQAYTIADFKPIINERMGEEIIQLEPKRESIKPKVDVVIDKNKGNIEAVISKEEAKPKADIKIDKPTLDVSTGEYGDVLIRINKTSEYEANGYNLTHLRSLKEEMLGNPKKAKVAFEIMDFYASLWKMEAEFKKNPLISVMQFFYGKANSLKESVLQQIYVLKSEIINTEKDISALGKSKSDMKSKAYYEDMIKLKKEKIQNYIQAYKEKTGEDLEVNIKVIEDKQDEPLQIKKEEQKDSNKTPEIIDGVKVSRSIEDGKTHIRMEYVKGEETIIKGINFPSIIYPNPVSNQQAVAEFKKSLESKKENTDIIYTIARHREVMNDTYEGRISLEDFKTAFEQSIASLDALIAELSPLTKDELLKMVGGMSSYRLKSEKKDYVVKAVADDIVEFFALGTFQYIFGDDKFKGVRDRVNSFTQESLTKFAEEVAKQREDHNQRILKYKAAIADPKTLEDFKIFFEYKGKDKMTDAQKVLYDELIALDTKAKQKEKVEDKAEISQVRIGDVAMNILETKHTKTGQPLFVVKLSERVDPDTYKDLNSKAKQLGGWYSSYTKDGAIAGFQFKERSQAEKFVALKEGNVSNIEKVEERQEEKSEKRINKLRENAENIIKKADEGLSVERLANTARRARMASSADAKLNSEKATAKIMLRIADAIDSGETKFLDRISTKAQVEQLRGILARAKYKYIEVKFENRYEEHKYDEPTVEMADYIRQSDYFFPKLYKENWLRAIQKYSSRSGLKLLSERINKMLLHASSDKERFKVKDKYQMEEIIEFTDKLPKDYDTNFAKEMINDHRRLKSMGVESDEMLRALMREFISFSVGTVKSNDKVKELERGLAGRKVGFDYFPTPVGLSGKMAALLEASEGMIVLEPSAGNGNLADAVRNLTGISCDVIEISSELRAIIEAKGYNVVAQDFMTYADKLYDRIIMNPPFSNRMDGEHVQHAFELLKAGGRIVAIMGEGIFFGTDKKAVAFREWADALNAEIEELPKNTFMDRTQTSTTGANARLVIIDKKAEDVQSDNSDNQWDSLKQLCEVMIPSESAEKEWSSLSDLCDLMIAGK